MFATRFVRNIVFIFIKPFTELIVIDFVSILHSYDGKPSVFLTILFAILLN